FPIAQRLDPLGALPVLEHLCRTLGLVRMEAVGPPKPPKGTFVCDSAPTHGYFIVFTPKASEKKIDVYFAERAHSFSIEAKAAYANLYRGLKGHFGEDV